MSDREHIDPSLMFSEAVTAVKLGQNDLARSLFQKVLKRDAQHEQALLWSAALCGNPLEAIRLLERFLQVNPANQQAMGTLSMLRLSKATSNDRNSRDQDDRQSTRSNGSNPEGQAANRTWI